VRQRTARSLTRTGGGNVPSAILVDRRARDAEQLAKFHEPNQHAGPHRWFGFGTVRLAGARYPHRTQSLDVGAQPPNFEEGRFAVLQELAERAPARINRQPVKNVRVKHRVSFFGEGSGADTVRLGRAGRFLRPRLVNQAGDSGNPAKGIEVGGFREPNVDVRNAPKWL
jgi:hypothetical protein